MDKSPDAFRTISEVADWLDVPTHVLRFWESRFAQVKPVKRAGGRRYYRPGDMRLIGGIKKLLHEDGMTIRGVQKLLREEGIKHVAGYSQPLEHEQPATIESAVVAHQLEEEADAEALPFLPAHEPERHADTPAEPVADAAWNREEEAPTEEEPLSASETGAALPFGSVRIHETGAAGSELPLQADTVPDEPHVEAATDDRAPDPEPVEEVAPVPLLSDAPDTDPDDDSPDHESGPGTSARLYTVDPGILAQDSLRLKQTVAALRAVRDRSAS